MLDGWIKHVVIWVLALTIPLVAFSYYLPEYTDVPLNNETFGWILLMSLGFSLLLVGSIKGTIHTGWIFLAWGFYLLLVSFGLLWGGFAGTGIDLEFNPFEKNNIYELGNQSIYMFVIVGAIGGALFGFGLFQNWQHLIFGGGRR